MYRASGALFSTMETVAEENPLRSATSRIVTAADCERLRAGSGTRCCFVLDGAFAPVFPGPATGRDGFESLGSMSSLYFALLLADTTARGYESQA